MSTREGIISLDQLRSEIGSPTADPREAAAVLDEELQSIIDRGKTEMKNRVKARLEERVMKNTAPSASRIMERVGVPLKTGGRFAEGSVPPSYYPMSFGTATSEDEKLYSFESSLDVESNGFFDRRRFKFVGNGVIVIPSDTEKLYMRLPNKTETNKSVGAEVISAVNQKIIQQATQMVQKKAQVGGDLEQSDLDQ